ncbi:50S ribosomal protein L4, partial [Patescibacteria group bacterium]|nr:50S ribosomal protein L4 [Patescibacteria group bacterium]
KLDKNAVLASRNIPGLETIEVRNINTLQVLSFKYLILTKETISELRNTLIKKKTFSKEE